MVTVFDSPIICFPIINSTSETYLVGEIIGVKDNFDGIRFADECLRLLRLATKLTRFPSIRYVGFGVAVHNLKMEHEEKATADYIR